MRKSTAFARAAPYLVVGCVAGYLYYVASAITYSARPGTLGPDFWPRLILGLIVAACIYEVTKILVLRKTTEVTGVLDQLVDATAGEQERSELGVESKSRPVLLLLGIALTAAYVAGIQTLGFFTATVPYLAAFIALGGYRRWGVVAVTSVLGTLLMFFFFMKVVYISLPLGEPPFRSITLGLMQLLGIR